jgi:ATP-dependent exoDNAse (exonuclease V) alpha subunit
LTPQDILVIDEAGKIGTLKLGRVLSQASDAGAQVVMVGGPPPLRSIEAGTVFRSLHDRHGGVGVREVRRQRVDRQREAKRDLATGRNDAARPACEAQGHVHAAATLEAARDARIDGSDPQPEGRPEACRIILTHTNDVVRAR